MTIFENKVINPEKPWSFMEDTKENILNHLEKYTLDPVFEKYGNFVYIPTWTDEEAAEKYKGLTAICGNFLTYSHAFSLYTDDTELIVELTKLVAFFLQSFKSLSIRIIVDGWLNQLIN